MTGDRPHPNAALRAPAAPVRRLARKGLALLAGLCVAVPALGCPASAHAQPNTDAGVAEQKQTYDHHDFAGVWMQAGRPALGPYALTPPYAAILKAREEKERAGIPFVPDNPCVPGPIVKMMAVPTAPIEIADVGNDHLVVTKENGSIYRIYLKRRHLDSGDLSPGIFGDSVAHWEGDTLVVDTTNLGGTTYIDNLTPHSDALHVVQRMRRTAYDRLEDQITIDDAKALLQSFVVNVTYKLQPEWELAEYFCTNERISYQPDGTAIIAPAK